MKGNSLFDDFDTLVASYASLAIDGLKNAVKDPRNEFRIFKKVRRLIELEVELQHAGARPLKIPANLTGYVLRYAEGAAPSQRPIGTVSPRVRA